MTVGGAENCALPSMRGNPIFTRGLIVKHCMRGMLGMPGMGIAGKAGWLPDCMPGCACAAIASGFLAAWLPAPSLGEAHGPAAWGGVVAGGLFVLPSLFILIALTWIYMALGHLPVVAGILYGIKPAVTAIVLHAAWRIGSRTLRNAWTWSIAIAVLPSAPTIVSFAMIESRIASSVACAVASNKSSMAVLDTNCMEANDGLPA